MFYKALLLLQFSIIYHCFCGLLSTLFSIAIFEPPHNKTNKMTVHPPKTQLAMDPSFPHADSEDSDQTGRMPRLI